MDPQLPRSHRSQGSLNAIPALVLVLVVGVVLGWVFLSGRDGSPGIGPTSTVGAGGSATSTTVGEGDDTEPDGTDPVDDGDGETSTTDGGAALPELQGLELSLITDQLRQPTAIATPPGDERIFVTDRFGRILLVQPDGSVSTFLDITDRVLAGGIEQGLLGLAFHPDYASNGRLFVYFTDRPDGNRQLSEFSVSAGDANTADPDSEIVLFERPQPPEASEPRHYGGMVQFGTDGYLYVSSGDGAHARVQPQDPHSFYGKIFRLDVDGGDPYAIPPTNPFADGFDGAPEVWAYGLRNPWRFDIDPETGLMFIGDVGQGDVEEINVVSTASGGYNFGWANMEGSRCFFEKGCNPADYTQPIVEYLHGEAQAGDTHARGCSVTGGITYRGDAIPEIQGAYFYADWCNKWTKSFRLVGGQLADLQNWIDDIGELENPNVFGRDADGEMLIGLMGGQLYRVVAVR